MKTSLQKQLALVAPSICIETIWEEDPDCLWDCDGDLDQDDYEAWQSEVRATAIVNGDLVTGSAYLGGTWQEVGHHPARHNEDISGYERQMTQEALEELGQRSDNPDIAAALSFLKSL